MHAKYSRKLAVGAGLCTLLILIVAGSDRWSLLLKIVHYAGMVVLVPPLIRKAARAELNSDLLAGISIVVAAVLGEHLAGAIVVCMLTGGEALETIASARATRLLKALAERMPLTVERRSGTESKEVPVSEVIPGDVIILHPHQICPVDGIVLEGSGHMDESFLTGESLPLSKASGLPVISGAMNGGSVLVVQVTKRSEDSRYSRMSRAIKDSATSRVPMRKLADSLGTWFTPFVLVVAVATWLITGSSTRFLSVLVVATPCPLLIAVPVAILGAISLAASRGIVVRDPRVLEQLRNCRTLFVDKTGTLTLGRPEITGVVPIEGFEPRRILQLAASLELYSKHPLSSAVREKANQSGVIALEARNISEEPGCGLEGEVENHRVRIVSRKHLTSDELRSVEHAAGNQEGMETVVVVDGRAAGVIRFHDAIRPDSKSFIRHLGPKHGIREVVLISGDNSLEVKHLARQIGVEEVLSNQSPEEKLRRVVSQTRLMPTLYIGDGINDAPSLLAATVGIALGTRHEITSEAAGVVILDGSLSKVDELFHISERLRRVVLQSALGGMMLSVFAIGFAALGMMSPAAGALIQEAIDLWAVLNALRTARAPAIRTDMDAPGGPLQTGST